MIKTASCKIQYLDKKTHIDSNDNKNDENKIRKHKKFRKLMLKAAEHLG